MAIFVVIRVKLNVGKEVGYLFGLAFKNNEKKIK